MDPEGGQGVGTSPGNNKNIGFQNLNYYILGGFQRNGDFFGHEDFCKYYHIYFIFIYFFLGGEGVTTKVFGGGYFYSQLSFWGLFLRSKYNMGIFFGGICYLSLSIFRMCLIFRLKYRYSGVEIT